MADEQAQKVEELSEAAALRLRAADHDKQVAELQQHVAKLTAELEYERAVRKAEKAGEAKPAKPKS